MRGSVIARTLKSGQVRYCIKYLDDTGRQRWETIGPSKREAERALASRIRDVHYGELAPASKVTFAEFIPVWDRQKGREVRRATMRNYRAHVEHYLEPFFGRRQLRQITLKDVQGFVNAWDGNPATLRRILATLSGIFKAAAVQGHMTVLDFSAVTKPRQQQKQDYQVLTVAEVEHLARCTDERYSPDILWLAFTGMRSGEWIALPANLIDLEGGSVLVRQAVDHHGNIGPTKSGLVRRVNLLDRAIDAYRAKLEIKKELGIPADCEWAFPGVRGGLINRANFFKQVWKPAITRAGFDGLRVHDLRHTYASLIIAAGAPAHFVANQLGHADPAFTMRAYAHWFEERNEGVVDQVNQALGSTRRIRLTGETDAA